MNQPWGLSGPQFLWIYGAGIAVFIAAPAVVVLLARVFGTAPSAAPDRALDAYEVGYLAGGAQRTAEVVIGELATKGVLRVDSAGRISKAGPAGVAAWSARCPHRIAAHALPDGLRAAKVRRRLAKDPGVVAIGTRLRADGLLIARSWVIAPVATAAFLWLALLVTGALRLAEGGRNHYPTGDLQELYVLTVALGVFGVVLKTRLLPNGPFRTRAGSTCLMRLERPGALAQVRAELAAQRRAELAALRMTQRAAQRIEGKVRRARERAPWRGGTVPGGQAALFGIALTGLAAVEDPALRTALLAGLHPPGSGGGYGGCGGGGGGGGGGGCGGGGCGGGGH